MARPRKTDTERRSELTATRWTLAEFAYLNEQAYQGGISRGEYIRRRALSLPVTTKSSRSGFDPALVTELNQIGVALKSGVGNNLNQITLSLNAGRPTRWPVEQVLEEVRSVVAKLDDALERVLDAHGS